MQAQSGSALSQLGLPKEAIRQIMRDIEATAYDTPKSWDKELRAETMRLGNAHALIVKGSDMLCGATANCQVWVFRKSDRGWRLLIDRKEALIADGLSFGPKKTRGIQDMHVTTNSSVSSQSSYTCKFDGAVYRAADD